MSKSSKARQAQSQHASAAAHCTNHYTRSVLQLERTLEERLTELSLLSQENSALKRREAALQSAVSSLAGSVSAATKAVLVSSAAEAVDALRATLRPASLEAGGCCSIADHKGFLLRMQQREAAVQNIMGQLGCVNPDELYSSWLLRRAFANPDRAFSHLARSKAERVAYVLATVQKLGLLLGKYDLLHHPTTAMGTPREQLDNLIDDLNERTLAFCLLAPPHRQLEMACLNMETGLPEPYPTGWWAVVIDAMHLTDDQKAALKICWDKVKPIKLALTAKYEALSAQLAQLQRKQLDQQRQFEIQAEHAIDAAISRKAARQQMDQQQQQQQQLLIAQQQQQQWLLQQQQQAMFAQQQQNGQFMQQGQQLNPAHAWEHQQQQHVMQQQPQEQLQGKSSILDTVMHEQELFQFCRVLLGSELEGLEGGMSDQLLPKDPFALAATATSAHMPATAAAAAAAPNQALGGYPGAPAAAGVLKHEPACCMPVAVNGAAGLPAAAVAGMQQQQQQQMAMAMGMQQQAAAMQQQQQHQHQGYAARHAPIQLQQDQKQFMQFSPALAAAAAASDQHLWLKGFSPDMNVSSPSQSPHGLMVLQPSDSGSQGTASGGQQGDVDDDAGMVVDAPQLQQQTQLQVQPSTSSTGADPASKSADSGSYQSKQSETPSNSTPSALETAAAAMPAAAAIVAGHKQRISGTGDVWQELAGVLPSAQQGAAQGRGSGQGQVMSDKEQRKLERQLDKITAQLKMQQYCMHTYVLNICSKKQMALKYVNCYPWVPESFSMCEALDELGW